MAINSEHPAFQRLRPEWELMRDVYAGSTAVKAAGGKYLPPTGGMAADGLAQVQPGAEAYKAYVERAQFYEFVSEGVLRMVGTMHRKPPAIQVPAGMEDVVENATAENEDARQLLRRINEAQLVSGRCGLLVDLPATPQSGPARPWICMYGALNIINWTEAEVGDLGVVPTLVVLDESDYEIRPDLTWELVKKYRVLRLNPETFVYEQAVVRGANIRLPADADYRAPVLTGSTLNRIPFVFANPRDITSAPDKPPLLGLGNLALAIYRADADYRQHLHLQGQDTLVIIGAPAKNEEDRVWRTGAGATIELDPGGDAKYIGIESQGLTEEREALDADKAAAANLAGSMVDARSSQPESGESRRVRVVAQTTTLTSIAQTGAEALQAALRAIAEWRGLDPEKVIVEPNLDFGEEAFTGEDMVKMMTARTMGFPISKKSMHGLAQDRGLTSMDYEEELEEIAREEQDDRANGTGAGGNPDDDGDDPANPRGGLTGNGEDPDDNGDNPEDV